MKISSALFYQGKIQVILPSVQARPTMMMDEWVIRPLHLTVAPDTFCPSPLIQGNTATMKLDFANVKGPSTGLDKFIKLDCLWCSYRNYESSPCWVAGNSANWTNIFIEFLFSLNQICAKEKCRVFLFTSIIGDTTIGLPGNTIYVADFTIVYSFGVYNVCL